ncbi:site-specific integrase [Nocardia miyunensis]|uniref:site-specific integrase n=1 Tax=Nocardia miyunensis TaxID=282684 RepID=UPI001FE233A8|nr:site-specific integrase [Nocardia miyunensis]
MRADVRELAGLCLPDGARRPMFDEDSWDFTVIGLPVQMGKASRRFEFTAIRASRWRLVAKELILALLAPQHPAVAALPRAYRTPLHLASCSARLREIVRLFAWLDQRNISSLTAIETDTCEAYLQFRRYVTADNDTVVGEQSGTTGRGAAQSIIDLVDYRDLFTADRVSADLRPWGGATASTVADMRSGHEGNTTPAVPGEILQPMLAAAVHLVQVTGPHAVALHTQMRQSNTTIRAVEKAGLPNSSPTAIDDILETLADYTRTGTPLPMLENHDVTRRLNNGWSPEDPLLPVATSVIARHAGYTQLWRHWLPTLREHLTAALEVVGVEPSFARGAVPVPAADGSGDIPWALPLHRSQAVALIGIVRTAAIILLAATSGMRSSELMELRVGCRRPIEEPVAGLQRFRITSKIVKGQPLGGTEDEWVVIEPAYRAIELAEHLHDDPREGALLFGGRFSFEARYGSFRNWVNSPSAARLGLAPIPEGPVSMRMLRQTLSLEMAYRPGGVLATKIHMKHCLGHDRRLRLQTRWGTSRIARRGEQARSRPQSRLDPHRVP